MTSRLVRTCVLLLLAGTAQAGLAASTAADRPADNGVTLERIMSDADWMGNAPEDAFWAPDGQRIYYRQKEQGSKIRDLHGLDPATGKSTKVAAEALAQADTGDGAFDLARARYVYVHDGDIFVRLLANGKTRQITRTPEVESHARFMADGRHVAFMSGDNWYLYDLDSGLVSRAADVETGKDPAEKDRSFDYLKSQQKRIFRTLREAAEEKDQEREHDRALQKADPTAGPLPFYLGDDIKILDKSLSPAGHYMLVVTQKADYDEGKHGTMPNYVTDSGYVETKEERTKVSRNAPAPQQLWMLDLAGHRMEKLDLTVLPKIESDPLAKLRKSALKWHVAHGEDADAVKKALKAPDVRPVTVGGIVWSDDGSQVAVQFRAIDNKDRWLATVNFDKARLVPRHRLHDDAWINWNFNDFGWLRDNRTLWFLSEESGYSHLYTKSIDSRREHQLTDGKFEVSEVVPGHAGKYLYFRANRPHPGIYEIYRVPADGGDIQQLTRLGGMNHFKLSPDGSRLLITHSTIQHHPELYVQANEPGAKATALTQTMSQEYLSRPWNVPQIVPVPSSHVDRPIYTKVYTPRDYDPNKTYPGVVFVHGAGYLQNVFYGWSYYYHEFMFHTFLTQHGFVVIDMDYRASEGYGRDWRTAIYRNMGHPELEDIEDGVAWMIKNRHVDPKRVGIYGGSYGGFMTFMAMFRDPTLFAAGAALRPVSDWAHYNHEYTSNILNTPEVDPVAYERSSPIEFADGLQHPMLICHGMEDNNVFFQDTVRLVERLIELKKGMFETAFFPLDSHGFTHPESWLYEYRRIWQLFQRTLEKT